MQDTDHHLLTRYVRNRDHKAFRVLVSRYGPMVQNAAQRKLNSAENARDITQEVFIRLAKNADHIHHKASLAGWLYQATHNCSIDYIRSASKRAERETEYSNMNTTDSHQEESPDWEEISPILDDALQELSPKDRDILLLRYFSNQSHGAVARSLGVTKEAASKRITRAGQKLRLRLEKRGLVISSTALFSVVSASTSSPLEASLLNKISLATLSITPATTTFTSLLTKSILMTLKTKTLIVATTIIAATGTSIILIKDNDSVTSPIADQKDDQEIASSTSRSTSRSNSNLRPTSRPTSSPEIEEIEEIEATNPLIGLTLTELLKVDPSTVSKEQWDELNLGVLIKKETDKDLLGATSLINELYEWSLKVAASNQNKDGAKMSSRRVSVKLEAAVANMVPLLFRESEDFSRDWIKSLQPKSLMHNTVRIYAFNSSPEKAIQWAKGFEDDSLLVDAATTLSYKLAKKDFDAAEAWVDSLSDENARHEGHMGLLSSLKVKKEITPEVYTWLEELQTEYPSHNYDDGWRAISEGNLDSDPSIAMEAAQKIKKSSFRQNMIHTNYEEWFAKDPNAAKAWLTENSDALPAYIAEKVENGITLPNKKADNNHN